jgi:hypothetical protein
MMGWAGTGRFAERAGPFRPIAENRDWGDGRRAQFMKNAAQQVALGQRVCDFLTWRASKLWRHGRRV